MLRLAPLSLRAAEAIRETLCAERVIVYVVEGACLRKIADTKLGADVESDLQAQRAVGGDMTMAEAALYSNGEIVRDKCAVTIETENTMLGKTVGDGLVHIWRGGLVRMEVLEGTKSENIKFSLEAY